MPDKPRYAHRCRSCVFLGRHDKYDLYKCMDYTSEKIKYVLIRWGNGTGEWQEASVFYDPEPTIVAKREELMEAFLRAVPSSVGDALERLK